MSYVRNRKSLLQGGLLYFMFMLKSQCLILREEGDSGKNPYVLKK